jgi:hypothetical protein
MLSDMTDADSGDRARPCPPLTASRLPNRECGQVIRVSRRNSTNVSPISEIRRCARSRPSTGMRNPVPSIPLPRAIAEGAGS